MALSATWLPAVAQDSGQPLVFQPSSVQISQAVRNAEGTVMPCPDLGILQPGSGTDWQALLSQLEPLMPRCLRNSEYFSLLGAAQLNTGRLAESLESLERALLLDPRNGSAQVDYAEALFRQGQLFSALDLNQQILRRSDVPEHLMGMLAERQKAWDGLTRQWGYQADVLSGYDNNLNGAPSSDQITLTLSGENVIMPLDTDYQPMEGPFLNLRMGARYRQLAPSHQHNVLLEARGRVSEDTSSDLLQVDTRYAFVKPGTHRSWQATAGMSHLFFGGSPLYTATELGGQYQFERPLLATASSNCSPYGVGAAQHQFFHDQNN
ncbi:MAG TPA: tetratricopeptide repeat protein, partial [Pseudohongiella sp.]|nr:tetratricopeptide repeat protein [Pseudohongiella sp.]